MEVEEKQRGSSAFSFTVRGIPHNQSPACPSSVRMFTTYVVACIARGRKCENKTATWQHGRCKLGPVHAYWLRERPVPSSLHCIAGVMTKIRSGISIGGRRQINTSPWAKVALAARRGATTIIFVVAVLLGVLLLKAGIPSTNSSSAIDNGSNTSGVGSMIRGGASDGSVNTDISATSYKRNNDNDANDADVVLVSLELDDNDKQENNRKVGTKRTADIRMKLYAKEAPEAARYVKYLASDAKQQCHKCTLYRGEPVPSYWGSEAYPDRYFDGGRWGPPYALVQGALLADEDGSASSPAPPPAETHNPIIERGMVAWAGGKGGPHFFIALAHHPEWGHDHTVFAKVVEDDMGKVDALLTRPLVSTKPKRPPIVSNFVDPIPLRVNKKGGM